MSTLHARQQTHRQVLPQPAALESVPADNPGVGTKRGTDAVVTAPGVQHDRGESLHRIRLRPGRHGAPARAGVPEPVGSDPGTALENTALEDTAPEVSAVPVHARVFVLDRYQRPLMPCHPARARELLAKGRARVHSLHPFTIRLVDRTVEESDSHTRGEGVTVKLDPGSRYTGVSVARVEPSGTTHGLFSVQVRHRGQQISRNLTSRAALRRGRRSRNLRYRAPRFNNRTKPAGWLAPSLRHRVVSTQAWVDRLARLAPVVAVAMELVRFDMQEMVNPEITGVQYQQGTLAGFEVREYLLAKWRHACAYCDASGVGPGSVPLNIDHIHPRARGGSNRVSNLTLACITCNQAKGTRDITEFVTDPARLARILAQAKRPLADAAAVNSTRWALLRSLASTGLPVATGSGGRTKFNRTRFGLPKSHTLDAICVGDTATVASFPGSVLVAASTGRGGYARTRSNAYGFPRLHLTRRKRHFGFATGDQARAVVATGTKQGTYTGRVAVRASGSFNITTATGTVQGIGHRHFTLLARADGWGYGTQKEASHAA